MTTLSCGPWTYNRFDKYESILEGKKPDFLDVDKDGDKKESFKKAAGDKKKECEDCGKEDCKCEKGKERKEKAEKSLPPWLKDKKEVKEGSCGSTGYQKGGLVGKAAKKKAIVEALMTGGLANNEVSAEVIADHMSDSWADHILEIVD